jgi:hypothetical protein
MIKSRGDQNKQLALHGVSFISHALDDDDDDGGDDATVFRLRFPLRLIRAG